MRSSQGVILCICIIVNSPYDSRRIVSDALYPDIVGLLLSEQGCQLLNHLPLVVGIVREHRERVFHGHLELYCRSDCWCFGYFYYEAVVGALLAGVFRNLKKYYLIIKIKRISLRTVESYIKHPIFIPIQKLLY